MARSAKTCRRCGHKVAVQVWPWHCRCGMFYRSYDDRGTSNFRRGLGDTIADTLERLGIKKKKKCKCRKRQEKLNQAFPYK